MVALAAALDALPKVELSWVPEGTVRRPIVIELARSNLDRYLDVATESMAHCHGFDRKAVQMAQVGSHDLRIHPDDSVVPLVRQCGVFEVEALKPDRERAPEQVADALAALNTPACRFDAQRAAAEAKRATRRPTSA